LRIAILGPFTGPSLSGQFEFPPAAGVLPPGYPGAPLLTVLAMALVERGHYVGTISTDYFTPTQQLEPFRAYHSRKLSAYFCPQRPHSFRASGGKCGRALDFFHYERQCLLAAIEDFRPDVVHAHWTYEFVWAALDSEYPTLATAHDSPAKVVRFMPSVYRASRYLMARYVLSRCEHVTAVSPDLASEIKSFVSTEIAVVPNPIANTVISAAGCSEFAFGNKSLLMVLNGWTQMKNGALALRAFGVARRSDPALRLVCFGAGYETDGPAHRWAKRRALDVGVEFRGSVPQDAILEQMRSSTALLHPSRLEACCMAIAEAMSLGLPVIAGRHTGGVAWQLDDGRAGILADVTKVDDLASAIITMTRDGQEWKQMSASARVRARQLFSIDRVVDQYLSLYTMVRGKDRSTAAATVPT
jgi:glycosyltransferase involved in cell wall biosynthesis